MNIATRIKSFIGGGLVAAGRKMAGTSSTSMIVRAGMTLGPWDALLHTFIPMQVNPYFYEALRRALPLLDGGIDRMVQLDGLVRFEGNDQGLIDEIDAAMREIPVDDTEVGLQSLYETMGNECYEQGFCIAERVMDARGRKLIALRTGDSKGAFALRQEDGSIQWYYRPPSYTLQTRHNGTDYTEIVLRNTAHNTVTQGQLNQMNYMPLDPARLLYSSFHPESNTPYGASVMRSIEFVAQNLLRIQNATGQAWDRFGDPSFQLTYKTKNRTLKSTDLDKRRNQLAADLSNTLAAKRFGNSADFVQAIGADDDITINVIGAKGDVLEIEMPAKHMVEQILAKIPVPGWMLGQTEAQTGRTAEQQSEMVLMESKVRFERRKPALKGVVAAWLRGQGVAWKPGDWDITQELPNLRDVMKQAQARFLNAQADMMSSGRVDPNNPTTPTGVTASQGGDPNALKSVRTTVKKNGSIRTELTFHDCRGHKAAGSEDDSEPWAENDPALPLIESAAVDGLLQLWAQLEAETVDTLGVAADVAGRQVWTFDASTMLQKLIENQDRFIAAAGAVDGPLIAQAFDSFVRGLENAASEFDAQVALDAYRDSIRAELATRGLELVRNAAVRSYHDGIVQALQDGAYDGLNPTTIADRLGAAFDLGDYDWTRLARSEIARAQSFGKMREYDALGVEQVNFVTAGGACPICDELASQGPYAMDQAPQPVDDSHPNCRCTLVAVDPGSNG